MTLHFSVSHPSEFYLQGSGRNIMQVTIGSHVVAVIYGYDALRPMLVSLNKSGNPRKPKKTINSPRRGQISIYLLSALYLFRLRLVLMIFPPCT